MTKTFRLFKLNIIYERYKKITWFPKREILKNRKNHRSLAFILHKTA